MKRSSRCSFPHDRKKGRDVSMRRGFTLVELLVTTALVALVGATVVAAVSGCLRVWGKINRHGAEDSWTELAFQSIRQDLHNLHPFAPVPFEGSYDTVSFPSFVTPPMVKGQPGEPEPEPGQVAYYFSGRRKTLCRSRCSYRLLRHASFHDQCDPVLIGVDRVRFAYYAPGTETTEPGWTSSWSAPEPPLAVKVEVRYDERTTGRADTQLLLVHVPAIPNR